ncbi:MAG: lipoprotein [Ignavibacteria bacterium]|nr:MAG: lipoprotein [Ignavibacteria bacterium]KAF0159113.1 MAG: lipoprotein [Ignavibacteria bacterium]
MTESRMPFDPVTEDDSNSSGKFPASMAPLYFVSSASKVYGTFFSAAGEGLHPTVLLLGGFPGNEVNFDIAHMLRRKGYNVFTFYPRGCWGSEGNYSWQNLVDDGAAAIKFLQSNFIKGKFNVDAENISLVGHSMGGFSALYNAIHFDEIINVCGIAPFNAGLFGQVLANNEQIKHYSIQQMQPAMEFVKNDSAEILLNELIANMKEWNLLYHLENLAKKNILVVSAKFDSIAPVELHHLPLEAKLKSANPNSEFVILETGHSFSDKRIQLMKIISDWFTKIEN